MLVKNRTGIVTDAFRKGQVGLGLGINQIAGAAGFLIGPIIGGLLTELSWSWVFLFNVPLGIFGVVWGIWRLREPVRPIERQHIDWLGGITLTIGLAGVLLALSMLAFPILPMPVTYTILGLGILGLVLFGIIDPRIKEPIIQFLLFPTLLFTFPNLSVFLIHIAPGAFLCIRIQWQSLVP